MVGYHAHSLLRTQRITYGNFTLKQIVFMVALWNRADHYIFALWLPLSFFLA